MSDVTDRLYFAIKEWVEANGGTAVVARVGLMPGERKYIYNVVIRITGKPPTKHLHAEDATDGD